VNQHQLAGRSASSPVSFRQSAVEILTYGKRGIARASHYSCETITFAMSPTIDWHEHPPEVLQWSTYCDTFDIPFEYWSTVPDSAQ